MVSSILTQKISKNDKMVLHPIVHLSEKMSPAEYNYSIGNKELLAIVVCINKWHMYLHTLPTLLTILTEHNNLDPFKTKTLLNHWQIY